MGRCITKAAQPAPIVPNPLGRVMDSKSHPFRGLTIWGNINVEAFLVHQDIRSGWSLGLREPAPGRRSAYRQEPYSYCARKAVVGSKIRMSPPSGIVRRSAYTPDLSEGCFTKKVAGRPGSSPA